MESGKYRINYAAYDFLPFEHVLKLKREVLGAKLH